MGKRSISGIVVLFVGTALLWATGPAGAAVHLEWRHLSGQSVYRAGDTVRIGLFAVSDDGPQPLAGIDAIVSWDPAILQMMEIDTTGAPDWIVSRFQPEDPYGLNEVVPPQDGDGFYEATSRWGEFPEATIDGLLIATFQFMAMNDVCETELRFLPSAGSPYLAYTRVYSGMPPPPIVTGTLSPIHLAVDCYDMNCDSTMDGRDITAFVLALTQPEAYEAEWGCVSVTLDDVQPFVAALLAIDSIPPAD